MRCSVHVRHEGGQVVARCVEFPECETKGATREEAMARLRASITFWLEACPCDQTAELGLTLDVVHET